MKKLIAGIQLGLFSLSALAGNQDVTLKGRIQGLEKETTVRISHYTNLVNFKRQEAEATVQPDGSFTLQLPLAEAAMVTLEAGDDMAELFLKPGDKLSLTYTAGQLDETARLKGDGDLENEYLIRLNRDLLNDDDFHYSKRDMYVEEKAYVKMVEEKYQHQRKLFRKYAGNRQISPAFKQWAESELVYNEALQKLQYPAMRAQLTRLEDPYALSARYYDFLKGIDLHNPQALSSLSYVNFLEAYINYRYRTTSTNERQPDYFAGKYRLAKDLLEGDGEEIICGRIMMKAFEDGPVQYSQQMLKEYAATFPRSEYLAGLHAKFEQDRLLARGSQAPDLKLEDIHGNRLSLADLKGQPVYLYFYSTGNGSSLMEQPHARELGKQFQDKDVAMVYVAVDRNEEEWKRVMTRKAWGGYSTIAITDSARLWQAFDLTQLPAAYMLDADGTIYHNDAKRPSSDGLRLQLQHLLTDATATRQRMAVQERQLALNQPAARPAAAKSKPAAARSRKR